MRRVTKPEGTKLTFEEHGAILRRTLPFIEKGGTRYSLEHLMVEAYLQGMRDTIEVLK